MRMPLRFVWGVEAIDNGDFLDPGDKGRMVADERFDLSSSEAQRWMLSFCKELRRSVAVGIAKLFCSFGVASISHFFIMRFT